MDFSDKAFGRAKDVGQGTGFAKEGKSPRPAARELRQILPGFGGGGKRAAHLASGCMRMKPERRRRARWAAKGRAKLDPAGGPWDGMPRGRVLASTRKTSRGPGPGRVGSAFRTVAMSGGGRKAQFGAAGHEPTGRGPEPEGHGPLPGGNPRPYFPGNAFGRGGGAGTVAESRAISADISGGTGRRRKAGY